MRFSRFKNFRSSLAVALLVAGGSLSTPVFAGLPNNTLEPRENLTTDSGTPADTSATPAVASGEPASYSGQIRRYSATDSKPVYGTLNISITALGKVSGSITWYAPREVMKVTGKQDLSTKQGSLVIRDASGNRVPGQPSLPFRISQKGKLVGSGITNGGETASFKLYKQSNNASGGSYVGGATLSLGGSNTYSGSSATLVNAGSLGSLATGVTTLTATGAVNLSGSTVTTIGSGSLISATGTLSVMGLAGFTGTLTIGSGNTLTIDTGSGNISAPALTADGSLTWGGSTLLLASVTSSTTSDGTVTYTGTSPQGGTATVVVRGAVAGGG